MLLYSAWAASIKTCLTFSALSRRAMLSAQKSATLRQLSYASADVKRRYGADLADSGSSGWMTSRILAVFPARDRRLHASSSHIWLLHDALLRAAASLCSEKHLLQATQETAA